MHLYVYVDQTMTLTTLSILAQFVEMRTNMKRSYEKAESYVTKWKIKVDASETHTLMKSMHF